MPCPPVCLPVGLGLCRSPRSMLAQVYTGTGSSYSPTTAGQRLSPYTQQLGCFSTDKQPLRWIASRSRHLLPLLLLSCSQTKGYVLLQNSIAKTRA